MGEEQVINFRFTAIHILSKNVMPLTEMMSGVFTFEIKTEIRVQQAMKIVIPNVSVRILDDATKKEVASFKIACGFEIIDFDKHIIKNDKGEFVIPKPLQDIIHPVAISTTRGIIYSELRGTYLNNAIMPVVFMKDLQPELPPSK